MKYTKIIRDTVLYGVIMLGCLAHAASRELSMPMRQHRADTPTQDILKAIQTGNIEQMKKLWTRYHAQYVDKAAIFKCACMHKQYALIAWLLKTTNLSTQYYHEYGTTLLVDGVVYNDVKLLALLLASSQIDINAQTNPGGWTALMMAAERASHPVIRFLLESGADKTIKDFEGRDAEWWARSLDRNDIISLLREHIAKK